MKKLIKTILVVFIFFLLSSCSNTRNIEHKLYDLDYNNDLSGSNEIIMSYETYSNFILEHEIKEEYTLDYFENKFLVAAYLPTTYNSDIKCTNYNVRDKNLIIEFVTSESNFEYDSTKLFLIEFDNSYLEKFNNIQICLNNQDITNNNDNIEYYSYCSNQFLYSNGYTKLINTEAEYLNFISDSGLDQKYNLEESKYNKEYFHLNGLIYLNININCSRNQFTVKLDIEGDSLIININFDKNDQDKDGYSILVEVDNSLLNKTNNIKVVLDGVDIINNYGLVTHLEYSTTNIDNVSAYYPPVVINSWNELIKNSHFNKYFDYYSSYDFDNKSLILVDFNTVYFECDVFEVFRIIENETLTFYFHPLNYRPADYKKHFYMVIEIDNYDLENINTINLQFAQPFI